MLAVVAGAPAGEESATEGVGSGTEDCVDITSALGLDDDDDEEEEEEELEEVVEDDEDASEEGAVDDTDAGTRFAAATPTRLLLPFGLPAARAEVLSALAVNSSSSSSTSSGPSSSSTMKWPQESA